MKARRALLKQLPKTVNSVTTQQIKHALTTLRGSSLVKQQYFQIEGLS